MPAYEERYSPAVKVDACSDESPTVDLYMEMAVDPDPTHFHALSERKSATLRITGNGTEICLVAWPLASLKKLAKFIHRTAKEYEKIIEENS